MSDAVIADFKDRLAKATVEFQKNRTDAINRIVVLEKQLAEARAENELKDKQIILWQDNLRNVIAAKQIVNKENEALKGELDEVKIVLRVITETRDRALSASKEDFEKHLKKHNIIKDLREWLVQEIKARNVGLEGVDEEWLVNGLELGLNKLKELCGDN